MTSKLLRYQCYSCHLEQGKPSLKDDARFYWGTCDCCKTPGLVLEEEAVSPSPYTHA